MTTFGRASDNDVVLYDDSISSHHAALENIPHGLSLRDLASTNGTFVNGTRIEQAVITEGDSVRLGAAQFTVTNGRLEPAKDSPRRSREPSLVLLGFLLVAALSAAGVVLLRSSPENATAPNGSSDAEQGEPQLAVGQSSEQMPGVDLFSPPEALGALVDSASGSVISIDCADGSGSGWPIRVGSDVLIVTNHHVIENCINTSVRFSNVSVNGSATVVSSDLATDLAVLRTTVSLTPLKTAEPPPIGAWLMVVGNPLGLERSVSYGTLTNSVEGLLITDAAINPGNSGGPVFDSSGRVVAVASAKISDESIDRIGILIGVEELCVAVLECNGSFPG
jgi:S1-C subfamily serine protease